MTRVGVFGMPVLLIQSYLQHPGGEEVLIDEGAKDATGPFEDVGHSPDARELLEKYYLGDVDPAVSWDSVE